MCKLKLVLLVVVWVKYLFLLLMTIIIFLYILFVQRSHIYINELKNIILPAHVFIFNEGVNSILSLN